MKKAVIILNVLFFSLMAENMKAQTSTFTKSDNVLGVGIGLGGSLYSGSWLISDVKRTPYLFATYERCIIDNLFNDKSSIGVGGQVGYSAFTWSGYWKQRHFNVCARGAFHYALVNKLDTYAGVVMGLDFESWKYESNYYENTYDNDVDLVYTLFAGARYYFSNNFAAFAELGYGISLFNIGLAIKF